MCGIPYDPSDYYGNQKEQAIHDEITSRFNGTGLCYICLKYVLNSELTSVGETDICKSCYKKMWPN